MHIDWLSIYIYTLPNSQQLYSQQWYCYIACDKLRGLVAAIYNSLLSKLTCYTVTSIIVDRFSENCCMRLYTLVVQSAAFCDWLSDNFSTSKLRVSLVIFIGPPLGLLLPV